MTVLPNSRTIVEKNNKIEHENDRKASREQ
jgi:hypothetical protein